MDGATSQPGMGLDVSLNDSKEDMSVAYGRFASWTLDRALRRLAQLDRMHKDRLQRWRNAQHRDT